MTLVPNIAYEVAQLRIKVIKNIGILTSILTQEEPHLLIQYGVDTHSIFTGSIGRDENGTFVVFTFNFYPRPPSKVKRIATMASLSSSEICVDCNSRTSILSPWAFTSIGFVVVHITVQD